MTDVIKDQLQKRMLLATELILDPTIASFAGLSWSEFIREVQISFCTGIIQRPLYWDQYTACVLHDLLNV